MNDKENQDFYFALCRCCLIAQAMKSRTICRLRIGLTEQDKLPKPVSLPLPTQVMLMQSLSETY
jgi:hypothetical protein